MESFDCAQDKLRGIQDAGWDPHFAVPILKLRTPHSALRIPHSAFCCPYSSAEITVSDSIAGERVRIYVALNWCAAKSCDSRWGVLPGSATARSSTASTQWTTGSLSRVKSSTKVLR